MTSITIELNGSVGIAQASEYHTEINEALQAGNSLVFDLSETTEIDASTLQLMYAAKLFAEDSEATVDFENASEQLLQKLTDCGASSLLDTDEETTSETEQVD